MRRSHFEALAPVCPRCLHFRSAESPLVLAHVAASDGDHVVHGALHCSDPSCWLEFPVIDGVPVIVPDPRAFLAGTLAQVSLRDDLPPFVEGMLTDVAGSGAPWTIARYHLSLYAGEHYGDWSGRAEGSQVATLMAAGLDLAGEVPGGPALDIGCAVGRGAHALAARTGAMVLGVDLNMPMLRFAQRLLIRGEARWPRRRVGLVYAEEHAARPAAMDEAAGLVDFWAVDAMALPFRTAPFAAVTALNVVDCAAAPANLLAEMARMLPAGGAGVLCTPYDWSENATEVQNWLGGHSQRGPLGGDSAAILRAALGNLGLTVTATRDGIPWRLAVHERSTAEYSLDMLALRRA